MKRANERQGVAAYPQPAAPELEARLRRRMSEWEKLQRRVDGRRRAAEGLDPGWLRHVHD